MGPDGFVWGPPFAYLPLNIKPEWTFDAFEARIVGPLIDRFAKCVADDLMAKADFDAGLGGLLAGSSQW